MTGHSSAGGRDGAPDPTPHVERAREHVSGDAYGPAGDAYTLGAYAGLGDLPGLGADATTTPAAALGHLLAATLCYRVAGRDERATNRAGQGALVAEDLRDAVLDGGVAAGAMWEYVGDFRLLSGLYGAAEAYDRAEATYATNEGDRDDCPGDVLLEDGSTRVFLAVARSAGAGLDRGDLHGGADTPARQLSARIRVKRERYPELVERAVDRGTLEPI